MDNKEKVNAMLDEFTKQVGELFSDKLSEIILFGSYARGDYDSESDVDIMILMNISREEEHMYSSKLVKIMENVYDIFGYSIVLSPIVTSKDFFVEWLEVLPFYKSVALEGVKIVA